MTARNINLVLDQGVDFEQLLLSEMKMQVL